MCDDDLWPNCGTSQIGSSCFSAVILLHQVCEYQKVTALLTTFCYTHSCSLGPCITKFLHCMYCAQMYAALLTTIWRSLSSFAEDSTFTSTLHHGAPKALYPACLSVCPGSACCVRCPLILEDSFEPRDNRSHDINSVNYSSLVWIWIRSHGGHQVLWK